MIDPCSWKASMATNKWDAKDPNDVIDYWVDFGSTAITDPAKRFLDDAATITGATVTVESGAGLTLVDQSFDAKTVRVRVSGGVPGTKYGLGFSITTNTGETWHILQTLEVKERTR